MEIIPPVVYKIISVKDCFIAMFVMATFLAVGWGIIGGLVLRVGGFKELFRITATVAHSRYDNTANKENPTTKNIDN